MSAFINRMIGRQEMAVLAMWRSHSSFFLSFSFLSLLLTFCLSILSYDGWLFQAVPEFFHVSPR